MLKNRIGIVSSIVVAVVAGATLDRLAFAPAEAQNSQPPAAARIFPSQCGYTNPGGAVVCAFQFTEGSKCMVTLSVKAATAPNSTTLEPVSTTCSIK